MSNQTAGIRTFPMFCIMMLGIGLMNHVIVLPPLLQAAKRDAWISVLAAIVPYLIWVVMLHYVMKHTNQQPLLAWIRQKYGRAVSGAIRLFFICYLFLIGAVTIKETITWTQGSYLPRTPEIVLSVTLILLCLFAARGGIAAIAIVSGILLPFVILFGDFVMSANLPRKDYSLLTPILENGPGPVLEGCLYVGGGLVELLILVLVQHYLKKKVKLWSIGLLGLFLIVLTLGPVTGAISEFGPYEAADLRYPSYEEWRLVKIGRYIQNIDFLSIYQWISGAFVRISIALLLITELAAGDAKGKRGTWWLIALGIGYVVLATLPFSDVQFLTFLRYFYLPVSLYAATGMLCVLFVMAFLNSRKTRRKSHG